MIYTITLNPAIDTIINVSGEISRGKNNRISKKVKDIGGKGTHVSVGLTLLGIENICTGITGKKDFDELNKLLKRFNVDTNFLLIDKYATRQNMVITDHSSEGSILITDNGIKLTNEIVDNFISEKLNDINKNDYIIISGNPSNSTNVSVFEHLLDRIEETKAKVVADVSGKYLNMAFKKKIEMIKPNQYEFSELIGVNVDSIEDCIRAYKNNIDTFKNIKYLCVSLGKEGSMILTKEEGYSFYPPIVKNINDTGAGDAFVSGLIYALVTHKEISEMGKFASAVGSSNVEEENSSGFNISRVLELVKGVKVEKLEV